MENNFEIMNEDLGMETEVNPIEMDCEDSGMGAGMAMLIGAGLMAATTAVVTLGKKAWTKWQDHRKLRKPDEENPVEPTDEQIEEATTK